MILKLKFFPRIASKVFLNKRINNRINNNINLTFFPCSFLSQKKILPKAFSYIFFGYFSFQFVREISKYKCNIRKILWWKFFFRYMINRIQHKTINFLFVPSLERSSFKILSTFNIQIGFSYSFPSLLPFYIFELFLLNF